MQHPDPPTIVSELESYQQSFISAQFCKVTYPCGICLEYLKGSKCLQLACEHIFCRPCLLDFWGMCINEGDVDRVGCPDPECIKKGRKLSEEDVSRVVSEQELERWKWLKTKKQLELGPPSLTIFSVQITNGFRSDNIELPNCKMSSAHPQTQGRRCRVRLGQVQTML